MNGIVVCPKEEMNIIKVSQLNEKILFEIFSEDIRTTVYVTNDNDTLVGIVTIGDFKRNLLQGADLINTKFTKVEAINGPEAEGILNASRNIRSIPIVDSNGCIIESYCKVNKQSNQEIVSEKVFEEIVKEVSVMKGEKIALVVEEYFLNVCEQLFEYNNCETIKVIWKKDFNSIKNALKDDDIKVYDLCPCTYGLRKIYYEKYNIVNCCMHFGITESEIASSISKKAEMYSNIVVLENSKIVRNALADRKITYISLDECVWNANMGCYEYTGDKIDSAVECLFMMCFFLSKPYIVANGRWIPVVALDMDQAAEEKMTMVDISVNILPKFDNEGIKYLLIKNPNKSEASDIKKFLKTDIFLRPRMDWKKDKDAITRFIGVEDTSVVDEICAALEGKSKDGFIQGSDVYGKYVNYNNGERYTVGNHNNSINNFYIFGPCVVLGASVTDQYTLGSQLRCLVADNYCIKAYGYDWKTISYRMRKCKYKKGDIVIIFSQDDDIYEQMNVHTCSIAGAYKNVVDLELHVWDTLYHCNKVVVRALADEIYRLCINNQLFTEDFTLKEDADIDKEINFGIDKERILISDGLHKWIDEVKKYKVNGYERVGAIVMNCNPFTLGHRYLIEMSRKKVDVLYIFVVEEDKSFFKFRDRLEMVRMGVEDMDNVIVVPSGKYIISSQTLPGYFEKEENSDIQFDATEDLEIFSKIIAKEFGIKVRFAGEEPTDAFTNRYNEYMGRILPENGIEFEVIPRKKFDDKYVISASLVRKYMKDGHWCKIKKLVMPKIYKYLQEHYG